MAALPLPWAEKGGGAPRAGRGGTPGLTDDWRDERVVQLGHLQNRDS